MRQLPTLCFVGFAALFASCEAYQYSARTEVEFLVPVEEVRALSCSTHNGSIEIIGREDGTDEVSVWASKGVHGASPQEAERNLELVEVTRELRDGTLEIGLRRLTDDRRMSPWVDLRVEAPAHLAVTVRSHNGGINVRGMRGALDGETHNGGVKATGAFDRVELESHNGGVIVDLQGDGPVAGNIETHNGAVVVTIGEGRSARVVASTHNGGVSVSRAIADVESGNNWMVGQVGTGEGKLRIGTHNGSVRVR